MKELETENEILKNEITLSKNNENMNSKSFIEKIKQ